MVNLTTGGDASFEKTTSQASISGREGSESSKSIAPVGELIQARQCGRSRALHINGLRVYRRADMEMVDLAGGCLVYTVDYFTLTVTSQYLESLREEFGIPNEVVMMVSGPTGLPSRPPPGYVTLFAEYSRAGLRLPFHLFLQRALRRLNVAPMQLNASTYRILISCYVLWHVSELS